MPCSQESTSALIRDRVVWSFFSTPFRVFAGVLGPIAAMMAVLALLPGMPTVIRVTAGMVVLASLYGFFRGYGHRVEATAEGVCYRRLGRAVKLCWPEIRRIGRYVPIDRNRNCMYVYVTRLETPPVDWREVDENTIQLQDRPGLLEAIQKRWEAFGKPLQAVRSGPPHEDGGRRNAG